MDSSGITPVMNVGGYGYGDGCGFGGNGLWLFAILALMNGGLWGGRDGRCATVEDINNTSNFSRLESQVQGIGTNQLTQFNNITNAISTLGYETLKNFNALGTQLAECCCATQRAVDSVKFDMANYASATNAHVTAQIQSIKDMMAADKAAAQAARIQQLELQQALCGVVRYPTAMTYNAGYPFACFNACGNCSNI